MAEEATATGNAVVFVDDPDDPRVALYRNLKDRDLRQRKGLFLGESELVLERLVSSRFEIRSVLLHGARWERLSVTLPPTVEVFVAPESVVEAIAGFPVHRGVLALAVRGEEILWTEIAARPGPLLVLEDVGDPDNIGALFRAAAAFKYAGVLCSPGTADPLYRKAIRSSMGWTLHVPFATVDPWPEALTTLDRTVIALTPATDADDIASVSGSLGATSRDYAVLLGSEGPGLTNAALNSANRLARIPMADGIDSLNVAMAAAIALYEFGRAHRHPATRQPDNNPTTR